MKKRAERAATTTVSGALGQRRIHCDPARRTFRSGSDGRCAGHHLDLARNNERCYSDRLVGRSGFLLSLVLAGSLWAQDGTRLDPPAPPQRIDFDVTISGPSEPPPLRRDSLAAAPPQRQDFDVTISGITEPPPLRRDALPSAPPQRQDFDVSLPSPEVSR